MERSVLKERFLWSSIIILIAALGIAVFPCWAEEPINLQQLFDGQTIQIDNVVFENFHNEASFPQIDFSQITVEKVGVGTLNPGLRFIPNPQLDTPPWSTVGDQTQFTVLTYQARIIGDLPLIKGTSLILEPGAVEPAGDYYPGPPDPDFAAVSIEDAEGLHEKLVYEEKTYAPSSDAYFHEKRDSVETGLDSLIAVSPYLVVAASSTRPGGKASLTAFEQRLLLIPAPEGPIADAGPDQAVFDQVSLDGSGSSPTDATYEWKLYRKDGDELVFVDSQPGAQVEFSNLEKGFYEARLLVKNLEGISSLDTALIAATGPFEGSIIEENAELNLWHFELKKYKYCKWSIARMLGTFDLPDDFKFHGGDDLVGKVTVQINRGEEPLIVMSDDLKLKAENWRYKSVIRSH